MRPFIPSKKQNRKWQNTFLVFALLLVIFFTLSPRSFFAVSSFFNMTAIPFWNSADSLSAPILQSRTSLAKENEDLRQQIDVLTRETKGYDFVVQENVELKKLFEDKKPGGIFAGILKRPGSLPFDIFLLDIGGESGISNGELALVDQNIALGKVTETYPYSAKIKAFSSPDETTDAFLGPDNISIQIKGAGGGTFTAELPRELDVREGGAAVLPGTGGFILAYVESKEEHLTDSFQKLYLRSPVNVFELKYVQITPQIPPR